MRDTAQELLTHWEGLINRCVFLEKRFVFCHEGLRLHPSELHVLLAIHGEPAANATRLAAVLGVTKGAVSQVLKRLAGKNVIIKRVDPTQKNEVTAIFTPIGRQALDAFLGQRGAIRQGFYAHLSSLSVKEQETIRQFLNQCGAFLPVAE